MTPSPKPKLSGAAAVVGTIVGLLFVPVSRVLGEWVEKKWGTVAMLALAGVVLLIAFALGYRSDRREYGPGYSFRAVLRQELAEATPLRRFWLRLSWAAFFALPVGFAAGIYYFASR